MGLYRDYTWIMEKNNLTQIMYGLRLRFSAWKMLFRVRVVWGSQPNCTRHLLHNFEFIRDLRSLFACYG